MADRGDTHYHVPALNRWFLVSSLLLLATVVWTVVDDWAREWKVYQREFHEIELAKAREALAELEETGAVAEAEELAARVEAARRDVEARGEALAAAETEAYEKKEQRAAIEEQLKAAKSKLGWDKYTVEERILHGELQPQEHGDALADERRLVETLQLAAEDATADYEAAEARASELREELDEAEKAYAAGTRDLDLVRGKIDQLDPSQLSVKAAKLVRDFPGLDFVSPTLQVRKQIPADLTFELNFTKKERIDMCTTCHMGADRLGFEDVQQPHGTHPRLDLFLASNSAHPIKDFGCTICHRGSGEALTFQRADHRPSDEEEEKRWKEEHGWKKQHHWDYPMLPSTYVEASCVQCHTDSLEIIAEEAPKLAEGYELVEQYGCYACHKIEWFPTERRPGPSLKNLAAKLSPEFVASWVAHPRSFRPTTWMPQIFHLENFAPDEVIAKANYGEGPEILGQAWDDTSVAAVTAFLFENHPEQELPPVPVEGDAERGREVFRLVGCLACHNMAPYPGEEAPYPDPAFEEGERNDYGPNLRGVATKLDRTWLYHWLKDPAAYWPGTRMPDLRLSDEDAADITAYMMDDPDGVFRDVPDGWEPSESPIDLVTLQEQARWFYDKLGRRELERRLAGEHPEHRWDQPDVLAAAVGEALVRNQGCYSCHEIAGLENEQPIGTELTNWASKTVDKLDFGVSYRKPVAGLPELDHHYREGWLERKLHRPRSFDLDKVKNAKEKLKMPWFDFDEREVEAIATFVLGLVDDEVQEARMEPTATQAQSERGMRVVRQKNCMACHVVDPGTVTYEHEGVPVVVEAEVLPFPDDSLPPRMDDLATLREGIASWEEYFEDELDDVVLRLVGPSPEAGAPSENVIVPVDDLVAVTAPRGGDFVPFVTEYYLFGVNVPDPEAAEDEDPWFGWTAGYDEATDENLIEDVDGVQRAYAGEELDKLRWTFAPPVLWNEGHKLQRDWFYSFLKDPTTLRPQLRVRMPSFPFEPGEAEAVADWFANKARWDWHSRYARSLRLTLGREPREALQDPSAHGWIEGRERIWPTSILTTRPGGGLSVDQVAEGARIEPEAVRGVERGSRAHVEASFDRLFEWGTEQGFAMTGPPPPSYERVERRSPSHLAAREEFLRVGHALAADAVNCFQCHPNDGVRPETPIAWAPDLAVTYERLREEWVREWLWSPRMIYPGTAMPENFSADVPQYQEFYPGSSNGDQIHAVMDWLFNMDRSAAASY